MFPVLFGLFSITCYVTLFGDFELKLAPNDKQKKKKINRILQNT